MDYHHLQTKIYQNKLDKRFNITEVQPELVLHTEEFGELCDAILTNDTAQLADAVGDIMVYSLGLCGMLGLEADDIIQNDHAGGACFVRIGRELGQVARWYRRSECRDLEGLRGSEPFVKHLGLLMGYCSELFELIGASEKECLEKIVLANTSRTDQVPI